MVIYGTSSTQLAKENIRTQCISCESQNSIEMIVYQVYADVYWIPFFPTKKTAITQCSHCKQVLEKKDFPEKYKKYYDKLVSNNRTPIWTFSGLFLVAILISWGIYSSFKSDEMNEIYIKNPKKGDVYEIKLGATQYTLYKVDNVEGDSVIILYNEYETNQTSGLSDLKLKGDQAYSKEKFIVHKNELEKLLEKGDIMEINRE